MEVLQASNDVELQETTDAVAARSRPGVPEGLMSHAAEEPPTGLLAADEDMKIETSFEAWISVLGAFLFLFPSYGWMQTIGTIQVYLELNQLSSYSTSAVGWIPGVFTALALFLGIQVGPLFDAYGPRLVGRVGCAIYIPSFFVLAQCDQYWQFMVVLGFWAGLGAAIVSMVGVAVVGKWFVRRRGLAMGVALCGSSTGGVVMPLLLRALMPNIGWAWSIRVIGFITSASMIIGLLCLQYPLPKRSRVDSEAEEQHQRKKIGLNFRALTSVTFIFVTIGVFALEFAIFGVFTILPTYATAAHFGADSGYALVAIGNAVSTLGRLIPGLAGDYYGHFNVLICMIIFTAVIISVILVPFGSTSLGVLYAFAALWGFGSGSFISLTPVCMGRTCATEDYGRYFGTMYFFCSFSLLIASPLSGLMLQGFGTQALAGLYVAVVMVGGIAILVARQLLHGTLEGNRRSLALKVKI